MYTHHGHRAGIQHHSKLWDVDDTCLFNPESKHTKCHSAIAEFTVEQWGYYQFDNAKIPKAMVEFVTRFVRMLGVESSKYSDIDDVCNIMVARIEWMEPYFFLCDMLINMSHNELKHTYRHRATGDILDPSKIETFQIDRTWDFKPYHAVRKILEHPDMVRFINSDYVPTNYRSREEALMALLDRISNIVWGRYNWLDDLVEEVLDQQIENLAYDHKINDDDELLRARRDLADDRLFWIAGTLGVMTWLKGPQALPFLVTHHIVYDQLLCLNDNGSVSPWPDTGDEVIIDGQDIYTHKQLEFLPNRRPDTCVCCGAEVHCTKMVNLTALKFPLCSCGETLDPLRDDVYGYHDRRDCQPYRQRYPSRRGFVCQRCIFVTVNNLADYTKCGRALCPATKCPHHMGNAARVAALTKQRTNQLTAPTRT